jgi:hypothetical protein
MLALLACFRRHRSISFYRGQSRPLDFIAHPTIAPHSSNAVRLAVRILTQLGDYAWLRKLN